ADRPASHRLRSRGAGIPALRAAAVPARRDQRVPADAAGTGWMVATHFLRAARGARLKPKRRNTQMTKSRNLTFALIVIAFAQLMVVLDTTIVNVALPSIQRALRFNSTDLEWVVNGYSLAFGGLLLLGGRAGDLFGRRRMFIAGVLLFAEGAARNRALGIYAGAAGGGGAVGLILGGLIVNYLSWRWVLFVNVPIAAALAIAAPRVLAASEGSSGRLDLPGAAAVTAGMTLLVYGLSRVATHSWSDSATVATLGAGAALLVLFVLIEL